MDQSLITIYSILVSNHRAQKEIKELNFNETHIANHKMPIVILILVLTCAPFVSFSQNTFNKTFGFQNHREEIASLIQIDSLIILLAVWMIQNVGQLPWWWNKLIIFEGPAFKQI